MNMTSKASLDDLCPIYQRGFFNWAVPDNLLFGDAIFADLYELSTEELAKGIPVEIILDRIVPEDRDVMARRIHDAILTGNSSASRYQILCPSGARKTLISNGRCLRDAEGIPSCYPGMVMLAPEVDAAAGSSPLETYTKAALLEAKKEGRDLTERYLSSALRSLGTGRSSE